MKNKKLLIGLGVLAAAGITIYLVTRKKDEKKSNFITDKKKPKNEPKVKNKGGSGTTKSLYE